jgi:hypothetical protein
VLVMKQRGVGKEGEGEVVGGERGEPPFSSLDLSSRRPPSPDDTSHTQTHSHYQPIDQTSTIPHRTAAFAHPPIARRTQVKVAPPQKRCSHSLRLRRATSRPTRATPSRRPPTGAPGRARSRWVFGQAETAVVLSIDRGRAGRRRRIGLFARASPSISQGSAVTPPMRRWRPMGVRCILARARASGLSDEAPARRKGNASSAASGGGDGGGPSAAPASLGCEHNSLNDPCTTPSTNLTKTPQNHSTTRATAATAPRSTRRCPRRRRPSWSSRPRPRSDLVLFQSS